MTGLELFGELSVCYITFLFFAFFPESELNLDPKAVKAEHRDDVKRKTVQEIPQTE